MCTLAVLFQAHAAGPLVVAANRDEWLQRPAAPLGVLREAPRTLGGRDLVAGGTWLAVNAHGVVAALTNQPGGRDPQRRSRGELPLLLTACASAREAVAVLQSGQREAWNPCWLLVGDREALFHVDMTGVGPPLPELLPPGVHVLENHPLSPRSAKAARIAGKVEAAAAAARDGDALLAGLSQVLAGHPSPGAEALEATCVHAGPYGTRSASLVLVPERGPPRVLASEGPPCTHPLRERSELWSG